MNSKKKQIQLYIFAFLIPMFMFLGVAILCKLYPFGNNSLLTWDGNSQYVNFYVYLKDIIQGDASPFYSFSKVLGGNIYGLIGYYLSSPLYLLFLFFKNIDISLVVHLTTMLKVGLCSLTFVIYLQHRYSGNYQKKLFFSLTYAFIGYNFAYYMILSWLDGVLLLPLVLLGIHKLIKEKKSTLYIFSLSLAIITNFYIGYMLCITSVIIYIAIIISNNDRLKLFKNSYFRFTVSSLMTGLLSMFMWLPTYVSLDSSRAEVFQVFPIEKNFSFFNIFSKIFTGSINGQEIMSGLPFIFVGIIPIIFIILFYLNRKINIKHKIIVTGLLLIFIFSFQINIINMIWHGFTKNMSFNYRYSFVFSFILIEIAFYSCINFKYIERKQIFYALGVFLLMTFIVLNKKFSFLTFSYILLDFIIVIFVSFLLYFLKKDKHSRFKIYIVLFIFIMQIGDLGLNARISIKRANANFSSLKQNDFEKFYISTEKVLNTIENSDSSMYRVEKTYSRTINDSMLLNYNGISHYSSTEKKSTLDFVKNLGLKQSWMWVNYYKGGTESVDNLLGIKYLLSKDDLANQKKYKLVDEIDDIRIYENQNALPLAILSDVVQMSEKSEKNIFKLQNFYWKDLMGNFEKNIYLPTSYSDKKLVNVKAEKNGYRTTQLNNHYINYEIKIIDENPLYVYIPCKTTQKINCYVNGKEVGKDVSNTTVHLGNFKVGDKINVQIKFEQEFTHLQSVQFAYENLDTVDLYSQIIRKRSGNITLHRDDYLSGQVLVTEDKQSMVLTIPYDESWEIKVDGKKVNSYSAWGTLLSFPLSKGEHSYTLHYKPKYLTMSYIVSLSSLTMYGLYISINKWKGRKA